MKTCTKCGKTKSLTEFSKDSSTKDGLMYICSSCNRKQNKQFRQTPLGILTSLKGQCKFWKRKPFNLTREEFIEWYEKQPRICAYCGLPEEELKNINDPFVNVTPRLTIDCKDNYKGYKIDNIILACRRCNALKNDFFGYEEMVEIGHKYIHPKWEKLLGRSF